MGIDLRWYLLFIGFGLFFSTSVMAEAITPKPGSPERTAICDAVRLHVSGLNGSPIRKALFRVDSLKVDGHHAYFEGCLAEVDKSSLKQEYLLDEVFSVFLKQDESGTWRILLDISRSDVPSDQEKAEIRRTFPKEIPSSIIPAFWKPIIGR